VLQCAQGCHFQITTGRFRRAIFNVNTALFLMPRLAHDSEYRSTPAVSRLRVDQITGRLAPTKKPPGTLDPAASLPFTPTKATSSAYGQARGMSSSGVVRKGSQSSASGALGDAVLLSDKEGGAGHGTKRPGTDATVEAIRSIKAKAKVGQGKHVHAKTAHRDKPTRDGL
jgi:hypothetical protein